MGTGVTGYGFDASRLSSSFMISAPRIGSRILTPNRDTAMAFMIGTTSGTRLGTRTRSFDISVGCIRSAISDTPSTACSGWAIANC